VKEKMRQSMLLAKATCIRKLKGAVELRLTYRIKMSVAVQIATRPAGPINQAPDGC